MIVNQKVKEGYNIAAQKYNSNFRNQFDNSRQLHWLVERLSEDSIILDLGCGAGEPVDSYLVSHGLRVIGVDISEAQIALAKQHVPEATYIVEDMSQLKPAQFQVDAVVSFYAIFHTARENHLFLLQIMRSFLNVGGLLLVTMGAKEWEGSEKDFCGAEMYWSHYGAEDNLKLVEQAGFSIVSSEIDATAGEEHLVVFAEAIEP